jgi:hypothetical protein
MQLSLPHPVPADGPFPFCAARAKPASRHSAASETNHFMYLIFLTSTLFFILFWVEIAPKELFSQAILLSERYFFFSVIVEVRNSSKGKAIVFNGSIIDN